MTNEFEKLESALFRVGRELEYPATPAIAARVPTVLAGANTVGRQQSESPRWSRFLVPLAAALILALLLLLFLPAGRDAVAQFLGLRGLRIFYATPTPTAMPTATIRATEAAAIPLPTRSATPRPKPTPTVEPFTLCCETSLADAQAQARSKLLVPPNLKPSKVYYQSVYNNGEQVVMVFGDPSKPSFTLYQAQRWIYGKLVEGGGATGKVVLPQSVIAETMVHAQRALWFSGAPHLVMVLDARGEPIYQTERTVQANTLVWETGDEDDGIVYRLETNMSMEDAVKLAESLQELP